MISLVVSWRNRRELAQALPSLLREVDSVQGELIVVNFGGDSELLDEQIIGYEARLKVVNCGPQAYFNKARAHNRGVFFATKAVLFFCDCDIILPVGILQEMISRLQKKDRTFVTLAGVTETTKNARAAKHIVCFGYELRLRAADGLTLSIVDHEEDADDGRRQAPGLLMVRTSDFLKVNGYNSALDGWGWEDQDMISRLTLGGGLERISDGYAMHVSHDDDARTNAYPYSDRWASRDKMFRRALSNYDRGDFGGSYTADVQELTR